MVSFDPETLERWQRLGPRVAYNEARDALFQTGASTSEDFLDVLEDLVVRGLLSWEEIETFEDE